MKPSPNIHAELANCARILGEMESCAGLAALERHWLDLLGALERIWNKCQHHFGKSPKWTGWKGRYERLRSKDQLLVYLTNARGANEHTVTEVVTHHPGSVRLAAGPTGHAQIRSLHFGPDGFSFVGSGTLQATFSPANVIAVAVTNRGRRYDPPQTHLGELIPDHAVLRLGNLGVSFYASLVHAAEQHFCQS